MLTTSHTVTPKTEQNYGIDPIIRLREFLGLAGVSRATVYRMMALGLLKRPVRLSQRAVGWRQSTVKEFLDSRPSAGGVK